MNYFKLNLPKNPLHANFTPKLNGDAEFWHIHRDVENVLNQETLSALNELNVKPLQVIIFGSNVVHRTECLLHADTGWDGYKWKIEPCAINWELNDTVKSNIQWHDVSEVCTHIFPDTIAHESPYPFNYSNAMVFDSIIKPQKNLVVHDQALVHEGETLDGDHAKVVHHAGWVYINETENIETLLESVTLEKKDYPILFNTSNPHAVLYKTNGGTRFCVSVRFDVDRFKNWQESVDTFSKLIYN